MARTLTYQQAINEALHQEMARDDNVILMGEDVAGGQGADGEMDAWGGVLGVTKGLYASYGDRVMDTPISESAFIGAAVGASTAGLRPVVELMFNDFLGVCFDQIFNQAAKFRYMFGGKATTPVVIRTMIGAGFRGAAQHSQSLYSIFTHIPGLKCVVPSTPYDAKGLLISAIRDNDPVIFCEHKRLYQLEGEVPEESYTIPLGEAEIVRDGTDVTIITLSEMVHESVKAAEQLATEGVDCEVIDLRTTSPLDTETLVDSVEQTGRVVVVDEANPRCSMATDISALIAQEAFGALKAPIKMVTAPHTPVPFSDDLEDLYKPNAENIISTVREVSEYQTWATTASTN
jgi:acetoin:2,6-dichlorophenolindophenol oxidoreductase subunit beta